MENFNFIKASQKSVNDVRMYKEKLEKSQNELETLKIENDFNIMQLLISEDENRDLKRKSQNIDEFISSAIEVNPTEFYLQMRNTSAYNNVLSKFPKLLELYIRGYQGGQFNALNIACELGNTDLIESLMPVTRQDDIIVIFVNHVSNILKSASMRECDQKVLSILLNETYDKMAVVKELIRRRIIMPNWLINMLIEHGVSQSDLLQRAVNMLDAENVTIILRVTYISNIDLHRIRQLAITRPWVTGIDNCIKNERIIYDLSSSISDRLRQCSSRDPIVEDVSDEITIDLQLGV